ncbi:MAG: hypothetical protein ACI4SV_00590 [Duodenibacillus sp.]
MALNSSQQFGYGSLIGMGLTTAINAIGAASLQRKNNAIAKSQANIARINAQMMEMQAQARLRSAEKDQVRLTLQAGQMKGKQRAAMAANGIASGVGGSVGLLASTDLIKEVDSRQIRDNAINEAWGIRTQAGNYMTQAAMAEANKKSAWGVAGHTLLQGASQIANQYMLYNAAAVFDGNTQSSSTPFAGQKGYGGTPKKWGVKNGLLGEW